MPYKVSKLFSLIENDGAVFISGYPNVFYYSSFTSEDAFLLMTKTERYIITDSRYFIQAKIQSPDFELIDIKKGWEHIFDLIKSDTVYFEENHLTYGMYQRILGNIKNKEFIPCGNTIDKPRQVKDKSEIEIISQAEAIGDRAFTHILEFLRTGISERDIAIELEGFMKKQGATDVSFETIVASGLRSAMPHGAASGKLLGKGDFVTLDFGCRYKGYCSDMTRTVVIGTPDSKQKEVYELVLKAQTTVLDKITVGMDCSEIDKLARDIIADGGYGEYFTHSLGHSVGVEIHETPVFSPSSKDILQNGNVLSVEPGIYIDGWGGVRIEDLIAVDDGEIVNLTHSPKELIAI